MSQQNKWPKCLSEKNSFTNGIHCKWERQWKVGLEWFYVQYVRDKTQNGVRYWRCEDYLKCKSRVFTAENDSIIRAPTEHSHPPNPARVAVAKSKSRMWDRAANSSEYTSNIIQTETQDMSLATAGVLSEITCLQRIVQRKSACPEGNGLVKRSPNYGPRAKSGPQSYFIRPAKLFHLVAKTFCQQIKNTNLLILQNTTYVHCLETITLRKMSGHWAVV